MILAVFALLLAFLAGWFARGWRPERGGDYNETWHTCLYVEPSDDALNKAFDDAKRH
jgi:hypothetical protein